MSAFPPHRSIPSIPVPPSTALTYLSSYLSAIPSNAYLLPNARLEASGPSAGSSNPVTLHNLKRVEAGLKGEWLAPSLEINEGEGIRVEGEGKDAEKGGMDGVTEGEWQDLEDYQREQTIENGEIGARQAGDALERGVDSEVERVVRKKANDEDDEFDGTREDSEIDTEAAPKAKKIKTTHGSLSETAKTKTPKDKEARKKEKKARHKEQKKQKEMKRKAEAETEP